MAVARDAEQRLGGFKPEDLANTAWVYATSGQMDVQLVLALVRAADRRLGDFKPHEFANAARA